MKELILLEEEINVIKDLNNSLDKTEILRDLCDYWFIKWVWTDSNWYIKLWLTVHWKQLLRQLEYNNWILSKLEFTLDLGLIKIKTK